MIAPTLCLTLEALERCTKHDDADYAALLAGRARLGRPHD